MVSDRIVFEALTEPRILSTLNKALADKAVSAVFEAIT